jgi:hypothetical protein
MTMVGRRTNLRLADVGLTSHHGPCLEFTTTTTTTTNDPPPRTKHLSAKAFEQAGRFATK